MLQKLSNIGEQWFVIDHFQSAINAMHSKGITTLNNNKNAYW